MLARAVRLEQVSLVCAAVAVALQVMLAGQSQAMKAAWIEDSLAMLPPIAFLVASRRIRRAPHAEFPYGHHRSIGVAHLVASVALLSMGLFLLIDSGTTLVRAERPTVGLTVLAGHAFWAGWSMIGILVLALIPPILLGRRKKKLAEPLHDKVLYADADMNTADWSSTATSIVGVLGIGLGLWWLDPVAAILISLSILHDGVKNLRAALRGLTDGRARTFDDAEPHPLIAEVEERARAEDWIAQAAARVRDEGHVLHVEMFVVPEGGAITAQRCEDLRAALHEIDWKIHDVVVAPVQEIPPTQAFPADR
ncbi:cation diffusion facilitator family transporter [Brachybacterium hainanense]|uniref:Cation diffusion facilitator family transporter n=1 Tax=Brachybacterium hainanense TaxID=1541174 RepID=A0ABV6RBJ3_9MICO